MSLRVPALSFRLFLSPSSLELTWLLSLHGAAPGGFGVSVCPISLLCTRSTPQFGARRLLCPKSEPSRTPSPPLRPPPRSPGLREEPRLAPLVLSGSCLSDCPGLARRRCPWAKCSKDCRFPRRPTGISLLRLFTLEPFRVGINFRHYKCS